jgi:hypothetical protein
MEENEMHKIFIFITIAAIYSGAAFAAPADQPKSRQTKCYDVAGAVISCATTTGKGQDGALQRGVAWPVPRFTVISGGTGTVIADNLTGLRWLQDANCAHSIAYDPDSTGNGTVAWQHALDFVKGINDGTYSSCGAGHTDWRLPNVNELDSLAHAGYNEETCTGSPCSTNAAWLNTQGFSNVQADVYWSSTTYAGDSSYAWSVSMYGVVEYYYGKSISFCVWPVRSDLVSITITPANPAAGYGVTQQFKATGTYKDGTTQDITGLATWSSSNTTIATINGAGLATTKITTGSTTIKAAYGGMEAATTLTVSS